MDINIISPDEFIRIQQEKKIERDRIQQEQHDRIVTGVCDKISCNMRDGFNKCEIKISNITNAHISSVRDVFDKNGYDFTCDTYRKFDMISGPFYIYSINVTPKQNNYERTIASVLLN